MTGVGHYSLQPSDYLSRSIWRLFIFPSSGWCYTPSAVEDRRRVPITWFYPSFFDFLPQFLWHLAEVAIAAVYDFFYRIFLPNVFARIVCREERRGGGAHIPFFPSVSPHPC